MIAAISKSKALKGRIKVFSLRFVRDKFAEYYKQYSSSIPPPVSIERREFGFLLLKKRIMLRHKDPINVDAFLKIIVLQMFTIRVLENVSIFF